MADITQNAHDLCEMLKRTAPELLDLLTARTPQEFESAFESLLAAAVEHLEQNSRNFAPLDETGLTAVFVGRLTMPGLTVTQETNSNGHVDITIRRDHLNPRFTKLGEAKIYTSPSYHVKGVGQLIGRYSTGRETRGLLLVYVKAPDIASCVQKLREGMDDKMPEHQTGPATDHNLKWAFLTEHKHSSGENVEVAHVGCNLYDSSKKGG